MTPTIEPIRIIFISFDDGVEIKFSICIYVNAAHDRFLTNVLVRSCKYYFTVI